MLETLGPGDSGNQNWKDREEVDQRTLHMLKCMEKQTVLIF